MGQRNVSSAKGELISSISLTAWSGLYILITAFALVGNVSIITVFAKRKSLRTRMNYYIIALAFSDLLIAIVIIPLWLTVVWLYVMHKSDQASLITKIFGHLDIFGGMLSILHLMVISLERLHAISFPLNHRSLRPASTLFVIAAVWLTSAFIAIISAFLPKGLHWKGTFIFYTSIGFFVPFVVILIAYVSLTLLVKNRRDQLRRMHTKLLLRQERKLALTSFFIIVIFIVTWLPFFSINLIFYVCSECAANIPYHVVLTVKAIHYSGSVVDTVVYAFRITEFRRPIFIFLTSGRDKKHQQYLHYKETDV